MNPTQKIQTSCIQQPQYHQHTYQNTFHDSVCFWRKLAHSFIQLRLIIQISCIKNEPILLNDHLLYGTRSCLQSSRTHCENDSSPHRDFVSSVWTTLQSRHGNNSIHFGLDLDDDHRRGNGLRILSHMSDTVIQKLSMNDSNRYGTIWVDLDWRSRYIVCVVSELAAAPVHRIGINL